MACLRPITIPNPRYKKLLKTPSKFFDYLKNTLGLEHCFYNETDKTLPFGLLPIDFKISVPCGKCAECRKSKRLAWSHRLAVETMQHKESTFLTLTLDDKFLDEFKDTPKVPLMRFIDRLRKHLGYRPKYFFVSELGEKTRRLHFHGVIFGTSRKDFPLILFVKNGSMVLCGLPPFVMLKRPITLLNTCLRITRVISLLCCVQMVSALRM